LEPVRELIDEMLRADVSAPRKQRHTCRRIFERLVDEHGAQVSYSTVVAYVGHRRPQIEGEAWDRAGVLEGFVPQTHEPGRDAEVDFGDVWLQLAGTLAKCHLLVPVPDIEWLAEFNAYLAEADAAEDTRHIDGRRPRLARCSRPRRRCWGRCRTSHSTAR
jgi:hypothetical protein